MAAGDVEERPIADAIDGVATPGQHADLFAHEKAIADFETARNENALHHAWLLTGPKGIGKATFAFEMAVRLLGGDERVRRQIAGGAHPGLLHIARAWDEKAKRFKTQIAVDDVRRTQAFFGMTAVGQGHRCCIVDPADDMSIASANALLKILEEPPKGAVFFVISHQPGRLLPTIRSRCRHLALRPLGDADVERAVRARGVEASDQALGEAVALSGGSPRQTLLALQGSVLAHYRQFQQIARKAGEGRQDWHAVHGLAEKLSARVADAEYDQFSALVQRWIGERARSDADLRTLAGWAGLWERTLARDAQAREFNLDRKQVVLDLFADLFDTLRAQHSAGRAI